MFTLVYLCLPCLLEFTYVYSCYLCLPQFTRECLPMLTHVYLCLPMFTPVFQSLLVFSYLALYTRVYLCCHRLVVLINLYFPILLVPTFTIV